MELVFEKATIADVPQIGALFEQGRAFLQAQGIDQWQRKHSPRAAVAEADIAAGNGYVLRTPEGGIAAYAALIFGIDPGYVHIDGSWLADLPYCAIHRVVTNAQYRGQGIAKQLLHHCHLTAKALGAQAVRIDTHADNKIMQRVILGSGYQYCGVIQTEAGDARNAYEMLL